MSKLNTNDRRVKNRQGAKDCLPWKAPVKLFSDHMPMDVKNLKLISYMR